MNSKERRIFRGSFRWRMFRKRLMEKQKVDPVTLRPLVKTANCHHCLLDDARYDDLSEEDNFVVLNPETHDAVHFLFLKTRPGEWRARMERLAAILEKMEKLNGKKEERQ